MQPYQEESKEIQRQQQATGNFLKKAGSAALGATGIGLTSKFAGRILPFLSEYIPEALAIKGLSKVSPNIGKFIQGSMNQGHTFDSVKDFIKEKIQGQEEQSVQKNPKEQRNIIEQYDPELHTYIDQALKKGRSLMEVGQKALGHGRFKKAVDKITKDHKAPWSAILQTVYGNMGKSQAEQPMQETQQTQGQNPNWANIVNSLKQVLGE